MILLVAAMVVVVLTAGVPGRVQDMYASALCKIGNQNPEECDDSGPGDDTRSTADDPAPNVPSPEDRLPTPEEREPDLDTSWPLTVEPAIHGGDEEGGEEEDEDGEVEDPASRGTLTEEESPLWTEPGEYPQMDQYEQSQEDYQSLGEGSDGPCFFWDDMCCPERTCETKNEIEATIQGGRYSCLNPTDIMEHLCRPYAAAMFEHFLDGSGEDVNLPMDSFLEDVPEFEEEIEERQDRIISDALDEAEQRDIDRPMTFPISTEKAPWGYPPGEENGTEFVYDDVDWNNAVGSFHYWLEGEITVYPPDEEGGDPSYELDTSVNMEKWYDWERDNDDPVFEDDWKENIAGYSQSDLAELHQYGMAQEFWIRGDADLPTVEG
ncbi:hypothetical protein F4561_003064 [Lipingzhangella halophila]|uniref:Uncharacterized protein n=1 Tax=Lipingzhangella halophila TaxID=1783352 RepID=A0A7W7RHS8_9ACTN|nr:hypothetical protein [Lipingzhangella halophila]MBB4932244.1 hypothetical protein [Lipingzhangella halophila]